MAKQQLDWTEFDRQIMARLAMSELGIRVGDLDAIREMLGSGATEADIVEHVREGFAQPAAKIGYVVKFVATGQQDLD